MDNRPQSGVISTALIAELGSLVSDPARVVMLTSLLEGRALTARELAERANITPQTASGHLAKLLSAGLIIMQRQGRHHYHRLGSVDVAHLLEAMHIAGAHMTPRGRASRSGPSDPAMRLARCCYDHLAGQLGVELAASLTTEAEGSFGLSAAGEATLTGWGADLVGARSARRVFCRSCLDWSERRPHLAGAVGAVLLERSLALGWLRRREGCRSLVITPLGERGFRKQFGVSIES